MSRSRDTANQINRVNSSAADATAITVDSSENVGIGTSSPTTGTSSFYDDLVIKNDTSGTGAGITLQSNTTNGFSGLEFRKSDGSEVAKIYASNSSGHLAFNLGSERMRILSGGGITFNGDTAAANALNDYEEGTWTPTQGTVSPWTSPTFSARYTKVGRLVRVQVEQTGGTIGWGGYMGGLPFSPSTVGNKGIGNVSNGALNNLGTIFAYAQNQIFILNGASNQTNVIFSISYFTDA